MTANRRIRSPGGMAAAAALVAAVLLLLPPGVAAQSQVKGNVSGHFFGGSGSADRGPDRWGVPRLDAMRGDRPWRPRRPINVGTIAGDGSALEKHDRRERPRKRRRVRRPHRFLRPPVVQVTHVHVRADAPADEADRRKKAVRRSDVARSRRAEEASREEDRGGAAPADDPGPAAAGGQIDDAVRGAAPAGERRSLLLVPPEEGPDGDPVRGDCALVKVRVPDGITWSHRVSLEGLEVSSITGASSRLRSEIAEGAILVFRSGESEFTVPGRRVESLTVGPCP